MQMLIVWFVFPAAIFLSLTLNRYAQMAHRSSEQIRLDATALSVCHHKKNFLKNSIEPWNDHIEKLQRSLDVLGLPCLSPDPYSKFICPEMIAIMRGLASMGKIFENWQQLQMFQYLQSTQPHLLSELTHKNHLDENHGSLTRPLTNRILSRFQTGFKRDELSAWSRTIQTVTGVQYPKIWVNDKNFAHLNHFEFQFAPQRNLVGVEKNNEKNWKGLSIFRHENRLSFFSRSSSFHYTKVFSQAACSISKKPYEVSREK